MAGPIPDNPDTRLRRKVIADTFTALGFPIPPCTPPTWAAPGKAAA